ncbi:MAG: Gfo/Idh/MocA family oxidoreductase [Bacteroidetes bacterium]|nr:Gfo/Idh/MocA family oxidoreductase [Bacteroidota bacterium]
MKNFVLIGAAGYIAPKHMKAIHENNGNLLAAYDKNDSVGIMDSYFPEAAFFTEFERFDRHLEKLKRKGISIDYVVVCSPNYLHDAHIRFGLKHGADVICEKPIVLNPWNIDGLKLVERETGKKIYTILQLRYHPSIFALKQKIDSGAKEEFYKVDLTYIAPRGLWYYASWKGDIQKSGGIATNIGIHFFDMLIWLFGDVKENTVHLHTHDRAAGSLKFERAIVRWFLSINAITLPTNSKDRSPFRAIDVNGESIEFSSGFAELHTKSYQEILKNQGFDLNISKRSIEVAHAIRTQQAIGLSGNYHPLASLPLVKHPFE